MSFDIQSHRTQLVLTAVAASAATYGILTALNAHHRRHNRRQLARDVEESLNRQKDADKARAFLDDNGGLWLNSSDPSVPPSRDPNEFPDHIVREQLARVYSFFGEEGMQKIRAGRVAIVGCGGVGSWAAVMLARS